MIENIDPVGIIADENDEIRRYVADYKMKGLHRISFWTSSFKIPDVSVCSEKYCVGYAILKRDTAVSKNHDYWHVFEAVFRKYIGGRGLGVKILFDELRPGIDPLGPENKLVIALGAITGIPFPGNSGLVVMAKSPLTGIWGEATAKGFFGPELRYAGYDAIVFEGVSDKPVYLFIQDDTVEIRNAEHLWGKPTRETQRALQKELGDERYKTCVIGIAGENLVRYASVLFDLNHVAGRTGMGAVLGSKKVKAIAVRGTKKPSYAREGELVDIIMKSLETKGNSL